LILSCGYKEVKKMSIERIDPELCIGCGICVDSCPMDVIRMDEKSNKAVIKYQADCMLCLYCERDCPEKPYMFLP
jgi:NAD-dependent dihydropyrimidine dehydrogenase PreA subunit